MSYTPKLPPRADPDEIIGWVRSELDELARQLKLFDHLQLTPVYSAPLKPRPGQIVFTDGTEWDPGAGAGFYGYNGSTWALLG